MKEQKSAVSGTITADGIWMSHPHAPTSNRRPGLFLDRDGVLVKEVHFLYRVEDVRLESGAAALVRWANDQAIPVVVVTNQSGIGRGMFGWRQFEAVQQEITDLLTAQGAWLDLTVACPYHPEHTPGWGEHHAVWRKPGAGMLRLAARKLNLLENLSWMVGDHESDVAAAKAAGLAGAIHVMTGYGASHRPAALSLNEAGFAVLPASDPAEALPLLQARFVAEQ